MVESEIKKRIEQWKTTACSSMATSTRDRYTYALEQFLTTYPQAVRVLTKQELTKEDNRQLANWLSEWVFVRHRKPLYVTAYALFLFLKFFYSRSAVDDLKDLMTFKQRVNPHSDRVIRDYSKINEIIKKLSEPYDIMCRLQWEVANRCGSVLKLRFNINLNDPKNSLIVRAIKDKLFNANILERNQDSFWKRGTDGLCFVLLHEKRGKVLERVISPTLYDWFVSWKESRLEDIRKRLDDHYNYNKKVRMLRKMNNVMFPISHRYYNLQLEKTAFSVGVQNFSSHWLRGTKATFLSEHGLSLRKIQAQLGHSSSTTTERYTPVDENSTDDLKRYLELVDESLKKE